ncbi:MAG: hypothetical protein Sv326_0912 [Candidatus Fermentimicrarchaeum limneticum]|uniref:Uncharacterized protein n=1 Tax=Fermentimicrarchaeum limneticum TaxID=2795018 RepID=A0A7D5XQ21_FERL1|nr:MAG: hypothetical protein Sv326_0912 [Candidatus Fermentimicrarchaeum limneticum]
MAMLKSMHEGFAVEKIEVRRQDYTEARLRKGEIDPDVFLEIMRKVPATESQRERFFGGGNSFLAAFEMRDDKRAHFLGIVVEKSGVIRMGKLPPLRDVLVGHPQTTHYEITCAMPEERIAKAICEKVKSMPDFKGGVWVKEPSFHEVELRHVGNELAGEDGEKRIRLKLGKSKRIVRMREEVGDDKEGYRLEYVFTMRGILTRIEIEKPFGKQIGLIEPRKLTTEVNEQVKKGKYGGVEKKGETMEMRERIGEVDAKYTLTNMGKPVRIDIEGDAFPEGLVIRPRKIQKRMREFLADEQVREWVEEESAKRKLRKELRSKLIK